MDSWKLTTEGQSESGLKISRVVTHGVFALDGGEWEVDNNIWVIGDDSECIIIDAAHTADPIVDAVAGRTVKGIVCT
ncbi:MBL fold metallo-hydrolase, partial [Klebsiella pneumoniae]